MATLCTSKWCDDSVTSCRMWHHKSCLQLLGALTLPCSSVNCRRMAAHTEWIGQSGVVSSAIDNEHNTACTHFCHNMPCTNRSFLWLNFMLCKLQCPCMRQVTMKGASSVEGLNGANAAQQQHHAYCTSRMFSCCDRHTAATSARMRQLLQQAGRSCYQCNPAKDGAAIA